MVSEFSGNESYKSKEINLWGWVKGANQFCLKNAMTILLFHKTFYAMHWIILPPNKYGETKGQYWKKRGKEITHMVRYGIFTLVA